MDDNKTKQVSELGPSARSIRYVIAEVEACLPERGIAVVKTVEEPVWTFVAFLQANSTMAGVVEHATLRRGARVSVALVKDNGIERGSIVSQLSAVQDPLLVSGNSIRWHWSEEHDATNERSVPVLVEQDLRDTSSIINNAHGADRDQLPGDLDFMDRSGMAGLHIGRQVATMRGAQGAFIEASAPEDSVKSVGASIESHTLTSEEVTGIGYEVKNTAISPGEAFGVGDSEAPLQIDAAAERVSLTRPEALPFYRLQHVGGAVAAGEEDLVLGAPAYPHSAAKDPPPILSKVRRSLSGALETASATGIEFVKAPNIAGIAQAGYGLDEAGSQQDLRTPLNPSGVEENARFKELEQVAEEDRITDAALLKLSEVLLSDDYRDSLIKRMAELGFVVASGAAKKPAREYGNPLNAQQYSIPEESGISPASDPVTGAEHKIYDTASFISQEPDGSICICDGYGSEIRMSRGNIYISPALDLYLRPGRDMSVMAGRYQSYNSQKDCTMNSARSVYVRATKDLKLSGGSDELGGLVSVESRSPKSGTASGIVLKSRSDLAATAVNDIYVGRNSQTTNKEGDVTTPDSAGSVILDAGNSGSLYTKASAYTLDAAYMMLGAFDQGDAPARGAGICLTQNRISLLAPVVQVPGSINMAPSSSTVKAVVVRRGKSVPVAFSNPPSCNLVVQGMVLSGNGIIANGLSKFNEGIVAKGVASTASECAMIHPKRVNEVFKPTDIKPLKLQDNAGDAAADSLVKSSEAGAYQDKFVMAGELAFPDYRDVSLVCVPGMAWQQYTPSDTTGFTALWKEPVLTSSINGDMTMCYPGATAWKAATISTCIQGKYSKTSKLLNGYRINSKEE